MSLFQRLFKPAPPPEEVKLPTQEEAWSEESVLYTSGDFPKYNPDDLIGKKGFGIYRKMMMDEQVKAVTRFKRDAITSRDWFFEIPETDELSDEDKEFRVELYNHIVENMEGSFLDAINGVMSAMYNGFSMTEKVYRQTMFQDLTYWGVHKLKLKPFDTFEFWPDEYGELVKIMQNMAGNEQSITLGKFIHHVQNPEYDEHYGGSELREAYRAWFGKDVLIKYQNIYFEKHAAGYRWLQPREGQQGLTKGTPEYTAAQNMLSNTTGGSGMIIPGNLEFKLQFPTNDAKFRETIDSYDLMIARALLVPNLMGITPSGQTGSFSQSTTQLEAFLWTLDADAMRLTESLNEQLFRQLGEVNFGDEYWPRFKFKPVSESMKLEIIKTWKDLVQSKSVEATDTDEKHLRELMDFPEKGEPIAVQPPPVVPGQGGGDQEGAEGGTGQNGGGDNNEETGKNGDVGDQLPDETIIGRTSQTISASAFSKAQKRVDFAVIQRNSDAIQEEYVPKLGETMGAITNDLLIKFKQTGTPDEAVGEIGKVKVDRGLQGKLNRQTTAMLKESFKLGEKHAEIELDKATGEAFSRRADKARVQFIADDYFKIKAFKGAGTLSDDARKEIEQIVLNGSKMGKTWSQIEKEVYETFAKKGFITIDQAREALGAALAVEDPGARLRTMVRTNSFEAINEARYAHFTDPALDGFVIGFEYSAILDSRTTQICEHMDGREYSTEWWDGEGAQYRPPNHFNCRSLLIPITELDELNESEQPSLLPQEGFR